MFLLINRFVNVSWFSLVLSILSFFIALTSVTKPCAHSFLLHCCLSFTLLFCSFIYYLWHNYVVLP